GTLGVEALWIKREDRSSPRYGGNKVRGLEFLLAGAPPGSVFVTVGGTGSTHCLATAVHAAALSCRAALAQFPQPETETSRVVAAASRAHAALVERATSRVALPAALFRAWRGARRLGARRWIPGGGAQPRAVVGPLLATLELAHPVPDPPAATVAPHGLILDPTYGAKAFAFFLQRGTGNVRRVVFWHTFAMPAPLPESAR